LFQAQEKFKYLPHSPVKVRCLHTHNTHLNIIATYCEQREEEEEEEERAHNKHHHHRS